MNVSWAKTGDSLGIIKKVVEENEREKKKKQFKEIRLRDDSL